MAVPVPGNSTHGFSLPRRLSTVLVCHGGPFQSPLEQLKSITTSPISPSTAWHHHPPKIQPAWHLPPERNTHMTAQRALSEDSRKRGFVQGLRLVPGYPRCNAGRAIRTVLMSTGSDCANVCCGGGCRTVIFLTTVVVGWRCGRNGRRKHHLPFLMGWGGRRLQ
ncbi:hypothetical protein BDZ85DRAFT_5787 [Elsinoe ampelina]|uniref:Uncharacterized protein n=1 Tax=Elsinoe ampelina TaxID=302913 RepID=A0A6A6GPG1_9PEZI|nr:hypothetical protein BDZ85DRAFT_5787 [Elsinoe ampelina]